MSKTEAEKEFEPDLDWDEGSEISAIIDLDCIGPDGVKRPVMITHGADEVFFALTLYDAERLKDFLEKALLYCERHQVGKERPN